MLSDWSYQSGKNRGGIPNLIAQVFHIVAMTIYLGFLELLNNMSSHQQQLNNVHIIYLMKKNLSFFLLLSALYILQSRSSKYSTLLLCLANNFVIDFYCRCLTVWEKGTERGSRKFWEWHIFMICLCSKYFKNWNIFGQILNIWVKLILKKIWIFFFNV